MESSRRLDSPQGSQKEEDSVPWYAEDVKKASSLTRALGLSKGIRSGTDNAQGGGIKQHVTQELLLLIVLVFTLLSPHPAT